MAKNVKRRLLSPRPKSLRRSLSCAKLKKSRKKVFVGYCEENLLFSALNTDVCPPRVFDFSSMALMSQELVDVFNGKKKK